MSVVALDRGIRHLLSLQREDGCWEGEMVWCTMILSQYVIVNKIAGRGFDPQTTEKMIKHYRATRTPDGAWGMHPESHGYVFFTTLAYVALRLLGLAREDPILVTAREWLHSQKGGVLSIPTWGKFWLSILDLYDYEGINPVPPELFLLPRGLPFHPRRYYCHTRLIYLAMAYIYGSRTRARLGPIVDELRAELYGQRYDAIDFSAFRRQIASTDVFVRPNAWLRLTSDVLRLYERIHISPLRRRALDACFRRIVDEQRTTQYQALSPVNGLLNCIALWSHDARHPDLAPSLDGIEKWKWEDERDGIRYAGARSNTWDTAFSMLALMEFPPVASSSAEFLRLAYRFLSRAQMTAEISNYADQDRDRALGGWCFSDGEHRWPVSDCTAEALCAVLRAHEVPEIRIPRSERLSSDRVRQAAEFILARQNADGGFGTYERGRGSSWLENVNPSEMFGASMMERSYLECTGSSIAALAGVRAAYPALLRLQIDQSIHRGIQFLRACQRSDGSYAGFWGINFTYAAFHVIKGLRAAGVPAHDPALIKAAAWLTGKQRDDGGWGEHYTGCHDGRYVEHRQSQVVMTSWALLALMDVVGAGAPVIKRGIDWLCRVQSEDGSWPRQGVNGVFFGSAMLDYRFYKTYFPVWALARHALLTRS